MNSDTTRFDNRDPRQFILWTPPEGRCVHVGPEQQAVPLPAVPLPVYRVDAEVEPSDNAVGRGLYDYLRRFPDCPGATFYAELLRDAYPHYLGDLAAQAVMIDAKEVDPAFVERKQACLRVLLLLEPGNRGLLWQLARGCYDLAMTFAELPRVRRHLLDAMRYGQDLLKRFPDDPAGLSLMAEVDLLFGDLPSAATRFRRLLPLLANAHSRARVEAKLGLCEVVEMPDHPRVDDLEAVGLALTSCADGAFAQALELLERLELDEDFLAEFASADYYFLLGTCRLETGDRGGAFEALQKAVVLDPDHAPACEALETFS